MPGTASNDAVRVDGAASCAAASWPRAGTSVSRSAGGSNTRCAGARTASGGRINTDAIDNVAGVNCSDHEVNIKILLGDVIAAGEITEDERNELLVQMTDAVAAQVLYGSYTQTQAMSLAGAQALSMLDVHARLIRRLEQRHLAGPGDRERCRARRRSPPAAASGAGLSRRSWRR